MKIEPTKLQRIIELASISKTGKPTIEEVELDFQEDKVIASNKEKNLTMLSVCEFKKEMFEEYQPIGKIVLRANDLLARLGKSFKGDKIIEFTVKDEKLKLIGKNEFYEEQALKETKLSQSTDKFEKTKYGFKLKQNDLAGMYHLEVTQLDELGTDKIIITGNGEELKAEAKSTTSTYIRKLDYSQKEETAELEVALDVSRLQKIVGLLAGPVWLIFTKQGPVSMSYLGSEMEVSYILAPIKE